MTALVWSLDASLAVLLVSLVVRAMLTRELFEALVLFIAFGLTLSLAWIRLGAPDLALAEAALGAGVTGALFLNAFHRLDRASAEEGRPGSFLVDSSRGRLRKAFLGIAAVLATGAVGMLLGLRGREALLAQAVEANLPRTGVSSSVTGVLLGFRAYDTLFEVCVLVVAMVAVWSLDRGSRKFARHPEELREDPVLDALVRLVTPVAGVTAVYLVWSGSYAAGGAFQGAALLAGVGVLLAASGLMRPVTSASSTTRVLSVMGLAFFATLGLVLLPVTGAFLAYPDGWAYGTTLAVEAALTLSIAVVLLELFIDVPAAPEADPRLERVDPTGDPLGRTITLDGAWIRGGEEEP